MSIEITPLTEPEQVGTALAVFLRAMVGLPFRDLDAAAVTEPGRFLAAVEDGQVVASADSYTSWLTVPGGARVPHAAVTHVGVLPTHRRRGVARALLGHQLRDVAARGEVVASLRASEAVIYERFGYGVASSATGARVVTRRAGLRDEVPAGGQVRLVDAQASSELLDGIHRRAAWTGSIPRPAGWWRLHELLHEAATTPRYVVVHSTDGVDDGYAVYQPEDTHAWFTSSERVVTVTDLVALTDEARAGLWRHLFSLDLVDVVAFDALPVDDPLPLAVRDRRAVTLGPARDETWLRLVDVEAALQARTYRDEDPVLLAVVDPLLPANEGVYELASKSVTRAAGEPDATVDVATLAAAYLGGTRWAQLAAVGRVRARTPDVVRRLDALFAVDALPFAGTTF